MIFKLWVLFCCSTVPPLLSNTFKFLFPAFLCFSSVIAALSQFHKILSSSFIEHPHMGMRAALCGLRPRSLKMTPQPVFPLALRPREAAKSLGISPRHLFQLTADRQIPCIRVGNGKRKTVLYSVSALEQWLNPPVQD